MAILISDFMKSKMFLFRGKVSRFLSYIIWSSANYVYTVYTKSMDKRNTINNTYTFIIIQPSNSDTIITISLSHAILRQEVSCFMKYQIQWLVWWVNFVSPGIAKSDSSSLSVFLKIPSLLKESSIYHLVRI